MKMKITPKATPTLRISRNNYEGGDGIFKIWWPKTYNRAIRK